MASCSICTEEKYSLRVIAEYENCDGCGTLICLDCFKPGSGCLICKSKIKTSIVENSTHICNSMDEKFGLFNCPDCNEKIPRRQYKNHHQQHEACRCAEKCKISQVKCGAYISQCKIWGHSGQCGLCMNKYCYFCHDLYMNDHKMTDCLCKKGKNAFCKKTNKIHTIHECEFYVTYALSSMPTIKNFCPVCGFYKKDEKDGKAEHLFSFGNQEKQHDCNKNLKIVRNYEHFSRLKNHLEQIKMDPPIDDKNPKNADDSSNNNSSYQKIPAGKK